MVDKSKDKYTMTARVTATIEKILLPALPDAIRRAEEEADVYQAAV